MSGVVGADDADHGHRGAEGGQVDGDVAGAARDVALVLHADDGDGRLGGDAADAAADVVVEHEVAHHEDALVGELRDEAAESRLIGR